ncbi:MAG: hypothetical protein ABR976_04005 [Terracidiphilus sp.]|jgi:hypothetical protein
MHPRLHVLAALLCLSSALLAQSEARQRYQLYGGYSFLSNSLNGVTDYHQGISGFDASLAIPPWHRLSFKVDFASYRGSNLGAPQHPYFIFGGGQYTMHLGREGIFGEALLGEGGANSTWAANNGIGQTASFASLVGGGLDTPLSHRLAWRVSAGYQYSYFILQHSHTEVPYQVPGLPNNFGRLSSGLVFKF